MGTLESAELKPDIDPLLFPPAKLVPTSLGTYLGLNRKRQYSSNFVPATDLMESNHKKGQPQDQDEYDDGYFAAAGSSSFTILLIRV